MKNIFLAFTILFLLNSCEDVVDIPLTTATPKLVIDANISWKKGDLGDKQTIKLTTTSDFYSGSVPPANGATVFVTNSTNTVFNFIENGSTGNYECNNFVPTTGENYTLTINYKGQTYTATDKLLATPPILNIQQQTLPGFTGTRQEIKFFYQDNGAENNYYLISFKNSPDLLPRYAALRDEFFQGNIMFGLFTNDEIKAGDNLFMSVESISNRYYTYFQKLNSQAGGQGGGPFSTPPATVRGNVINQTNNENFPLGYFTVTEIDTRNYLVQ